MISYDKIPNIIANDDIIMPTVMKEYLYMIAPINGTDTIPPIGKRILNNATVLSANSKNTTGSKKKISNKKEEIKLSSIDPSYTKYFWELQ